MALVCDFNLKVTLLDLQVASCFHNLLNLLNGSEQEQKPQSGQHATIDDSNRRYEETANDQQDAQYESGIKNFDLYKWNLNQVFLPSANANFRKLDVNA